MKDWKCPMMIPSFLSWHFEPPFFLLLWVARCGAEASSFFIFCVCACGMFSWKGQWRPGKPVIWSASVPCLLGFDSKFVCVWNLIFQTELTCEIFLLIIGEDQSTKVSKQSLMQCHKGNVEPETKPGLEVPWAKINLKLFKLILPSISHGFTKMVHRKSPRRIKRGLSKCPIWGLIDKILRLSLPDRFFPSPDGQFLSKLSLWFSVWFKWAIEQPICVESKLKIRTN